ncbi:tautomerase family protein [Gluconobacter roseus]|uniref:Tautomerase YrdN n=1 Tax=Gluconobacter roseus NBRC 3990 TaxID=1307950 RepID=A0A4Y3MER4_9PROT|nr:tautomerase family protein [Gluconobacter roseus]KXV44935.1 tautomerase [Gluconobacter roseus]GBR46309.1 4-oxalocrotonate tautomerase [Gluconobacter roseus NBRC 3990]GEB04879.1 putative tautomerase YrdN [Gluconobacter roseus NBRC 3990]GLP94575.1 putative tautomerase YrdN [Gluconobacter roseus NBRC 3990]
MPLIRFDMLEGRSEAELATLLDAAHQAVLDAFHVPPSDRYQIVHEHRKSRVRIEDTGLGIPRTDDVMIISITTRPRTVEEKTTFFRLLTSTLSEKCGIAPSDVMVNYVENTDADWSFGNGEAQFLNGKLGTPKPS